MQLLIAAAVIAVVSGVFCLSPVHGAEPKPAITNLDATAWICEARMTATISGPADPVTVWFFWGTEDGDTSAVLWQHATNDLYQVPGDASAHVGGLLPGTSYCFRVCAQNGGGKTWSDPVWFHTKTLFPIKSQVGTVVTVK